jgi:hypothetical protein
MKSVFVVSNFRAFNDFTVCRPLLGFSVLVDKTRVEWEFQLLFEELSKKVSKNTNIFEN